MSATEKRMAILALKLVAITSIKALTSPTATVRRLSSHLHPPNDCVSGAFAAPTKTHKSLDSEHGFEQHCMEQTQVGYSSAHMLSGSGSADTVLTNRREYLSSFFSSSTIALSMILYPSGTSAEPPNDANSNLQVETNASEQPSTTFLVGTATLKPGTEINLLETTALYITARPETMNNAPKTLFDAMGGRSPPVLTARFPIGLSETSELIGDTFSFAFELTINDLTPEGAFGVSQATDAVVGNEESGKSSSYWWARDNLIISARLDLDGVAATRDPEDLVGRSISLFGPKYSKCENASGSCRNVVEIQLEGRGVGGKFFTRKQNK